jgi:polypeptide N-acetylgalactosaminyltransferase
LGEPLERYVKYLPEKVKLIKTSKREGLIRARMMGASLATGDVSPGDDARMKSDVLIAMQVLMFQDGHTENNVQWAEPLLEEIRKNPATIIQPHVDAIDQWTFQYEGSTSVVPRGGFSWDLRYTWMELPKHEKERLNHQLYQPQRTPTLVGCAVMVRKDYFFSIGGFDDGMNIWGGENIELAFRNWLCGGQVLNHPCSRVAHTFKPFSYHFDGDREKIVQKNQMRLAELWMDEYKTYFLAATYSWPTKHIPFTDEDRKSLEPRMNLKKKLGCKSFKWFMETIVPEIPTPPRQAHFYDEVANIKSEACFYLTADGYVGLTFFCFFHRTLPQNLFYIDNDGRLMYQSQYGTQENKCLRVDKGTWLVKVGPCVGIDMHEKWDTALYAENEGDISVVFQDDGVETKLCMTQVTNVNKMHYREQMPQLLPCERDNIFQKWRWTYVFDFNYDWENPS